MKFTILENTEITINNKSILLEAGDVLEVEENKNGNVNRLIAKYRKAVDEGDTEEAEEIGSFLYSLGINL